MNRSHVCGDGLLGRWECCGWSLLPPEFAIVQFSCGEQRGVDMVALAVPFDEAAAWYPPRMPDVEERAP